jgi:hypothetical protein
VIGYHLTSPELAAKIAREGLVCDPPSRNYDYEWGVAWQAMYGCHPVFVDIDQPRTFQGLAYAHGSTDGSLALVRVDLAGLELLPDLPSIHDWLTDEGCWPNWEGSFMQIAARDRDPNISMLAWLREATGSTQRRHRFRITDLALEGVREHMIAATGTAAVVRDIGAERVVGIERWQPEQLAA